MASNTKSIFGNLLNKWSRRFEIRPLVSHGQTCADSREFKGFKAIIFLFLLIVFSAPAMGFPNNQGVGSNGVASSLTSAGPLELIVHVPPTAPIDFTVTEVDAGAPMNQNYTRRDFDVLANSLGATDLALDLPAPNGIIVSSTLTESGTVNQLDWKKWRVTLNIPTTMTRAMMGFYARGKDITPGKETVVAKHFIRIGTAPLWGLPTVTLPSAERDGTEALLVMEAEMKD